jgi:hypothetical protein
MYNVQEIVISGINKVSCHAFLYVKAKTLNRHLLKLVML